MIKHVFCEFKLKRQSLNNRASSMDIPQQPKVTSAPSHSLGSLLPETASKPVEIKALNLETDKIYPAIVSKLVNKNAPPLSQEANANTGDKNSEWLLKLNGKLLLISSEKPLKLGQTLHIKLSANSQTLSVLPPPVTPTSSTQTPHNTPYNNASVSLLLSAINQVMTQQVSLKTGLAELTLLSEQSDSAAVSKQAKLILELLSKQAPAQQSLTSNTPTSPLIISHLLKESGLFFESSIMRHSNSTRNIEHQLSQIQQAFNSKQSPPLKQDTFIKQNPNTHPNAIQTNPPTPSPHSAPRQNLAQSTQPQNMTTTQFDAVRAALLAKIKATSLAPQNLHQQNAQTSTLMQTQNSSTPATLSPLNALLSNSSPVSPLKNSHELFAAQSDLKGLLLSITAALKSEASKATSSEQTYTNALAQFDLLKNPFNFPHLTQQQTSSTKAESLLADQQFTTGQLLKLIAGMLNRIQFNQLNGIYQSQSKSNESSASQSWFFELPVNNPHHQLSTFDVRIDKEHENTKEPDPDCKHKKIQWTLSLSFNFEQLGAIYVQISLTPPAISSMIWADTPATLDLINREKKHFQNKLAELGLEVGDITCQAGHPKLNKTRLDRSLVDIKA